MYLMRVIYTMQVMQGRIQETLSSDKILWQFKHKTVSALHLKLYWLKAYILFHAFNLLLCQNCNCLRKCVLLTIYIKKKNSKGTSYKGRGGVFFIIHVQMALVCKKSWMPTNTFNWILFIWIESVEEGENRL